MIKDRIYRLDQREKKRWSIRSRELSSANEKPRRKELWRQAIRPGPGCTPNSSAQELLGFLKKADPTNRKDLETVSTLLSNIWDKREKNNPDFDAIEKAQAFIRTAYQFQTRSPWEG